jgi:hypothetical protein
MKDDIRSNSIKKAGKIASDFSTLRDVADVPTGKHPEIVTMKDKRVLIRQYFNSIYSNI